MHDQGHNGNIGGILARLSILAVVLQVVCRCHATPFRLDGGLSVETLVVISWCRLLE